MNRENLEKILETQDTVEETNFLEEQLNEMTVEELADILAETGISTKGNKQSLVAKVLKAVKEGVILFEAEEDLEALLEDGEELIGFHEIFEDLVTKELKELAEDLGIKVVLKDTKSSLIEKIIEEIREADIDKVTEVLFRKI